MALPTPAGSDPCCRLQLRMVSKLLEAKTSPYFGGLRLESSGSERSSLHPGREDGLLEHHCGEGATRAVLVLELAGDF